MFIKSSLKTSDCILAFYIVLIVSKVIFSHQGSLSGHFILILPLRILYRDDRLELNWTEYIGNSFCYVLEDLDVSLYAENLRTVHNRL